MTEKFKYDVVGSEKKERVSKFPQYFLGSSAIEAEKLLKQFESYINNLASSYASAAPSIDKSDFFIEGVEALAKAKKDFKPDRGVKFGPYAKFLIVDAMNDCIRRHRAVVQLPVYINKANKVIYKIKILLGDREDDWFDILYNKDYPDQIKEQLLHYKSVFEAAASRARLTPDQLAERAEFLPATVNDADVPVTALGIEDNHDSIMARLVVDKIMPKLNDDERIVAELIMQDLNNSEIARRIGRSDMYVADRIRSMKAKVLKMITGE